jgi:hypothetical protein
MRRCPPLLRPATVCLPIDLLTTIDAAEAAPLSLAALIAAALLRIARVLTAARIALTRPPTARASRPGPRVGDITWP